MSSEFGIMRDNLQELYCAIKSAPHNREAEVVANKNGTHLYYKKSGWGRLWTFLFKVIWLFDGGAREVASLKQALDKTSAIFQEEQRNIYNHIDRYKQYLSACCSGLPIDENPIHAARKAIASWHDSTYLIQRLAQKRDSRLTLLFQRLYPDMENARHPIFQSPPHVFKACLQFRRLIRLEGHFEGPLPYEGLAAILKERMNKDQNAKEVDSKELAYRDIAVKKLEQWIGRIESLAEQMGVRALQNGFRSFVEHMLGPQATPMDVAAHLAFLLTILNIKPFSERFPRWANIFAKEDPIHMEWRRNNLAPGRTIQCNERAIKLGNQIGRKEGKDNNVYFEIAGDPTKVVWVSLNRAILGIKWQNLGRYCEESTRKKYSQDVGVVKIEEIDTSGRCAIVERLAMPFTAVQWTSKETLSKEDEKVVKFMQGYFLRLLSQNETPTCLSIKNMMYTSTGELKFRKIPSLFANDYNAIVDCAYEASMENLTVYRSTIDGSGIYTQGSKTFYENIVEKTLKAEEFNIKRYGASLGVVDSRITDRAVKLASSLLELKAIVQKSLASNMNRIPPAQQNNVEAAVNKKLRQIYLETRSVGFIWQVPPNIIVEEVLKSLNA